MSCNYINLLQPTQSTKYLRLWNLTQTLIFLYLKKECIVWYRVKAWSTLTGLCGFVHSIFIFPFLWEAHYRWLGGGHQTCGMPTQMNLLLDSLILCLHHLCQVFFTFSEWKGAVTTSFVTQQSLRINYFQILWSPLDCPSIFKPRSYSKCVLACPNSGS